MVNGVVWCVVRNKMGFNNPGAWALARRLGRRPAGLPCGVNLGKNATTPLEKAVGDYLAGLETLYGLADFFVVNVSSPNTEGLRSLQRELKTLIGPLTVRAKELAEQFDSVIANSEDVAGAVSAWFDKSVPTQGMTEEQGGGAIWTAVSRSGMWN